MIGAEGFALAAAAMGGLAWFGDRRRSAKASLVPGSGTTGGFAAVGGRDGPGPLPTEPGSRIEWGAHAGYLDEITKVADGPLFRCRKCRRLWSVAEAWEGIPARTGCAQGSRDLGAGQAALDTWSR